MSHLQLTKRQKELAIFGFIRKNYIYSTPVVINQLCLRFFDEILYIMINGDKLKQLLNMKHGDKALMHTFKYNDDITIKSEIYVKDGIIYLFIWSEFDKSKILNIMYNFEMQCRTTNTYFKYKNVDNNHRSIGWPIGCLRISELKKINNLKQLLIEMYIDIYWIKYKDDTKWLKPICLNKIATLQWTIDNNLLNELKTWDYGKTAYNMDDGMDNNGWIINIYPNGTDANSKGDVRLFCSLIKWPFGVKHIECKGELMIDFTNKQQLRHSNDFRLNVTDDSFYWYGFMKHSELIQLSDPLVITAKIQIQQLRDDQNVIVQIPKDGVITHNV